MGIFKVKRILDFSEGSAKVTGGPPGLQIQCGALEPSQVGSIPMHFRQKNLKSDFDFKEHGYE